MRLRLRSGRPCPGMGWTIRPRFRGVCTCQKGGRGSVIQGGPGPQQEEGDKNASFITPTHGWCRSASPGGARRGEHTLRAHSPLLPIPWVFGSFQDMLLESIDTRTVLIGLPLDSSAMCPSTEHPLANVSQELRGPTIVTSAVLATDTFRFQNHFSLVRVCDSSPPWLSPYLSGHYF